MTSCNFGSLPSFNRIIFDKISKKEASSYILDYVAREYEAIIPCPPIKNNHFSSSSKHDQRYKSKRKRDHYQYFDHTGLPSRPLSSTLERMSYKRVPTTSLDYSSPPQQEYMTLRYYIECVVQKSRMDTGTLLTSLSYARRLKSRLSSTSKGMECTHHRIFLATLIIASKYIHDSAIKNKYWVNYALQLFSGSEINLMEKQLLQLLEYNLEIDDFETIVNDVVQIYLQEHDNRRQPSNAQLLEQLDWYPCDKQQYYDSAYASSSSSSYLSSTPVSTNYRNDNNQCKLTPPLISFD